MTIHWDPSIGALTTEYVALSPTTILNHEGDHALTYVKDSKKFWNDYKTPDKDYKNKLEKDCIKGTEQQTALKLKEIKLGQVTRTNCSIKVFLTT